MDFEEGFCYGKGENEATKGVRFELLWRDYMRLCRRKFGDCLFSVRGFRGWPRKHAGKQRYKPKWMTLLDPETGPNSRDRMLQAILQSGSALIGMV
jgi:deoxyribodipyrimidine photo-lyase